LDDLSLISWFIGKFNDEIVRFREWEGTSATAAPMNPAQGDSLQPAIAELGHS
jgi:hypothetical protein